MIEFKGGVFRGCYIESMGGVDSFNTLEDYGLTIINTDCIGAPEQEQKYIDVPYRDGLLDATQAVVDEPVYKSRQIKIKLKGIRDIKEWTSVVSDIRNRINGKVCKIIFDDDRGYFWIGRVTVSEFERNLEQGYFTILIPKADPYKYDILTSTEPWKWDNFNFVTGVINRIETITVNGENTIKLPKGHMPVSPQLNCTIQTELKLIHNNRTYVMKSGINRFPSIKVNGSTEETFKFTGKGTVQVMYRGGSL